MSSRGESWQVSFELYPSAITRSFCTGPYLLKDVSRYIQPKKFLLALFPTCVTSLGVQQLVHNFSHWECELSVVPAPLSVHCRLSTMLDVNVRFGQRGVSVHFFRLASQTHGNMRLSPVLRWAFLLTVLRLLSFGVPSFEPYWQWCPLFRQSLCRVYPRLIRFEHKISCKRL